MVKILYIRDKRSPIPKNENISKVMSANVAKNTKPELILRKELWKQNIRGYRLHSKIAGRPDIVFVKKKLAVFVNGCYWHRCPYCNLPLPKTNVFFWETKFNKNVARDKKKIIELRKDGWNSLILWECEINKNRQNCINRIKKELS